MANKHKSKSKIFYLMAYLVIVIAALLATIWVYFAHSNNSSEVINRISSEAQTSREDKKSTFIKSHQSRLSFIENTNISNDSDILSEYKDVCELVSIGDRVITGWKQVCSFNYKDLLPTSLTKNDVTLSISGQSGYRAIFGDIKETSSECGQLFALDGFVTLFYYNSAVNPQCAPPDTTNETVGSIKTEGLVATHYLNTYNNTDLDKSGKYLGIFSREVYYESANIGCKQRIINLSCEPPLSSSASGFKQ